ncbi:type III-A CRISPR-associated protein Csm2 [Hydrogenivirga sp. 128-5-R1-1]|uniref:type III-A CRISPR-associated protein Csm2 n=1 Tax=Hydrogenivirga sp. 128-5-R1-1 TaxID=392423 RepID=UPI00015F16F8|nr:type III-A CRISPR-associated protein Csm2 [Hydrogenivirga sp. 128-5-R1-1]EDP76113.1 hypothetical protein HG1285_18124 [Hydrogenivirga sp. 128-5-R1-1]
MSEVAVNSKLEEVYKQAKQIVEEIYPRIKELQDKQRKTKDKETLQRIKNELKDLRKEQSDGYESIVDGTLKSWADIKIYEVQNSNDMDLFIRPSGIAEAIACSIDFKTTQLRKIFHQLRSLQYEAKQGGFKTYKVKKVIALLAYSAGRKLIDHNFFNLSKGLLSKVEDANDLNVVVELLEAIVAYRKYYES